MTGFGFKELKLHKLWGAVITRNLASIKVLEKAGFQKEGILREDKFLNDHYEDVFIFGLPQEEAIEKQNE